MNLSQAPILLVDLIHIWIMYLEMVLWSRPKGLKIFRMTPQKAADAQMQIYGLVCVMIAGIGGAITIGKKSFLYKRSRPLLRLLSSGTFILARGPACYAYYSF